MSVIETALAAGERVSSLLGMPWGGRRRLPEADALLLHAYSLHKSGLCPACGGPLEECTDPGREWDVDDLRVCHRTVAMEEWRKQQGENRPAGVLPAVVPVGAGGSRSSQAALVAALASPSVAS